MSWRANHRMANVKAHDLLKVFGDQNDQEQAFTDDHYPQLGILILPNPSWQRPGSEGRILVLATTASSQLSASTNRGNCCADFSSDHPTI
jgi:hypothetical protein